MNLIHIATHGKYFDEGKGSDSDAMQRSVLALAGANLYEGYVDNDGLVNASEIAGMTMYDCNLVVLSACESALANWATMECSVCSADSRMPESGRCW